MQFIEYHTESEKQNCGYICMLCKVANVQLSTEGWGQTVLSPGSLLSEALNIIPGFSSVTSWTGLWFGCPPPLTIVISTLRTEFSFLSHLRLFVCLRLCFRVCWWSPGLSGQHGQQDKCIWDMSLPCRTVLIAETAVTETTALGTWQMAADHNLFAPVNFWDPRHFFELTGMILSPEVLFS